MTPSIIGRKSECTVLARLLHSKQPELLAIYGRRRVGKTYLIRNYYADNLAFYATGQAGATIRQQLDNFREQLCVHFPDKKFSTPENWKEAINQLSLAIWEKKKKNKK